MVSGGLTYITGGGSCGRGTSVLCMVFHPNPGFLTWQQKSKKEEKRVIVEVLNLLRNRLQSTKISLMPRLRGWGHRLQFLMGGAAKSCCKGMGKRRYENYCGHFAHNLIQEVFDFYSGIWDSKGGGLLRSKDVFKGVG